MTRTTIDAITALREGSATAADIYEALGLVVVPHESWRFRKAIRRKDGKREGLGAITWSVDDALSLFDENARLDAIREAVFLLDDPVAGKLRDSIASALCAVAMTNHHMSSKHIRELQEAA